MPRAKPPHVSNADKRRRSISRCGEKHCRSNPRGNVIDNILFDEVMTSVSWVERQHERPACVTLSESRKAEEGTTVCVQSRIRRRPTSEEKEGGLIVSSVFLVSFFFFDTEREGENASHQITHSNQHGLRANDENVPARVYIRIR